MFPTIQIILLAAGTAGLVYFSRASLLRPLSHGFYRFLAWEMILGLAVLNLPCWFCDPLAWHQLVSWGLLVVCILPVVYGVMALKRVGEPRRERADPALIAFEKTTRLVTGGAYRYIRHPMYSSLFLLAWGVFFKLPSLPGGILAALATAFLFITARIEERENILFFGEEYQEYMKRTKRFLPFLF